MDVRPARGRQLTTWLLRRLIQAIFVVLAMTVIVFVGVHRDRQPDRHPDLAARRTRRSGRARSHSLGLDQPLWQQYLTFLYDALHGDLGSSFVFNEPALTLILQRMPATLELAVSAVLLSMILGVPLGLYRRPAAGWLARAAAIMAGSILGFSLPTFWVGLMLIMVFAVQLGWLPSTGRGQTAALFGVQWSFLTLGRAAPPAACRRLTCRCSTSRWCCGWRAPACARRCRWTSSSSPAPRACRRHAVIVVHVLKNIMIPVVTVVGLEFGSTIAFAVVTESVFAWPGMGKLIIDSINVLDRPVIVAYLMMIVLLFVVINLVVDLALHGARSAGPAGEHASERRHRQSPVGAARGNAVPPLRRANSARRRSALSRPDRVRADRAAGDLRAAGSRRRTRTTSRSSTSWTAGCRPARTAMPATPTGSAPTTRAATCSPACSTGCASASASASARRCSPPSSARRSGWSPPMLGGRIDALIMRLVDLQLSLPVDPGRADDPGVPRQGRRQRRAGAGDRGMGLLRPHRARDRAGGAAARIYRGGGVPRAAAMAHHVPPPAAELPAAADRHRHASGGARHRAGGDAVVPRPRRADHASRRSAC